jgi:hypothetical protein
MLHRARLAMQDGYTGGNLSGEIEIDESFIGGKARNMHKDRKVRVMLEVWLANQPRLEKRGFVRHLNRLTDGQKCTQGLKERDR